MQLICNDLNTFILAMSRYRSWLCFPSVVDELGSSCCCGEAKRGEEVYLIFMSFHHCLESRDIDKKLSEGQKIIIITRSTERKCIV